MKGKLIVNVVFSVFFNSRLRLAFDSDGENFLVLRLLIFSLNNLRGDWFLTHNYNRRESRRESLKKGYGIPKNHKPGVPLRPIVSSFNSITVGVEQFLQNI